jgi:hypothetical protein
MDTGGLVFSEMRCLRDVLCVVTTSGSWGMTTSGAWVGSDLATGWGSGRWLSLGLDLFPISTTLRRCTCGFAITCSTRGLATSSVSCAADSTEDADDDDSALGLWVSISTLDCSSTMRGEGCGDGGWGV